MAVKKGRIDKSTFKKRFIALAKRHGKAISVGNSGETNRTHNQLHALYGKAKENGLTYIFSKLIMEDDEFVILWAATFSMKTSPELAKTTLQELNQLPSIAGISAGALLKLWEEGKLEVL